MKRTVFRISVLGMIVALGLLAIAHAQRTDSAAPPPPDDSASNPLRNGPAQSPVVYPPDTIGPADTDLPPGRVISAPRATRGQRRQRAPSFRRRASRPGPAATSPRIGRTSGRRKCGNSRRQAKHSIRGTPTHAGHGRPLCFARSAVEWSESSRERRHHSALSPTRH